MQVYCMYINKIGVFAMEVWQCMKSLTQVEHGANNTKVMGLIPREC